VGRTRRVQDLCPQRTRACRRRNT